jgi:ATP-dependent DNA helicase DinG
VLRARDVLGFRSPLSHSVEHWEHREGQLEMADAVELALEEERHLFVEAGTGTGKTLAYLVPAILSGRKVIVSTATRALQEQIFAKDLPLVAGALQAHGVNFRASLMKGLGNYVCLRRLNEARASGSRAHERSLARIVDWVNETQTGDRAELADLPEDAEAWRDVASSSETRIGTGCQYFDNCFVTRMRREAEEAQIVVVNHHLFLADLALRTGPRGAYASVLPAHDVVIFDEAHALEDVATDFFGMSISSARIDALLREAERSLAAANALEALKSGPVRSTLEGARDAAKSLFACLGQGRPSGDARRMLSEDDMTPAVRAAYYALDVRLEALEAIAWAREEEAVQLVAHRVRELRASLRNLIVSETPNGTSAAMPRGGQSEDEEGEMRDLVRWIEIRSRSVALGASPIDVGATLRRSLFDRVSSVVCTSATLATGESFHFAKARLGAPPEARELLFASPFDFASQSVLYLPEDLPDPTAPGFEDAAVERIADLTRMTDGGAFVLCTSTRAMQSIHDRLHKTVRSPLLVQGERPKHLLLARFRSSGRAVLVATMSFWEGVDVPGWALRLVIIDKIPFAPPNDPVVAARCARLDREGGNGFTQYSVPAAAMTLKQGFGRLIRNQRDSGIVAILDKRIVRRGYGRALLASLPPARRIRSMDELRARWAELAAEEDARVGPPSSTRREPPVVLHGADYERD